MRDSKGSKFNSLRWKSARLWLTLAAAGVASAVAALAYAKPQQGTFIIFDIPAGGKISFQTALPRRGSLQEIIS